MRGHRDAAGASPNCLYVCGWTASSATRRSGSVQILVRMLNRERTGARSRTLSRLSSAPRARPSAPSGARIPGADLGHRITRRVTIASCWSATGHFHPALVAGRGPTKTPGLRGALRDDYEISSCT